MKILTDIKELDIDSSAICVGTFDGLHKGHMVVINKTVKHAKAMNAKSIVFTFWPHPQEIIFPEKNIEYLNTYKEKIKLFEKSQIDYLVLYPFDKAFSKLSSETFIKEYLIAKLKMKFFVIGYDHQFGNNREGKYDKLKLCAKDYGFGIERIEQEAVNDEFISSTKIRQLIKKGEVDLANLLLGYSYFVSGLVIKGQQIGKTIGFPTANVDVASNKILPLNGVYFVRCELDSKIYNGIANIGTKPTVQDSESINLEVHIFDLKDNIYGKEINVQFLKHHRNEMKFDSLELLKNKIEEDQTEALEYFKNQD